MILELISNLSNESKRTGAAKKLAEYFGAIELIVFIKDPEIGILLPGKGFLQTLPNNKLWQKFITSCLNGFSHGEVPYPDSNNFTSATGFSDGDSSVVVLIGSIISQSELDPFIKLLPLLSALLKQEQVMQANKSLALVAEREAGKSERLAFTLDNMRHRLSDALTEKENDKEAIQQLMNKKDEFISIASHELKTPLTSLKAYLQVMERTSKGQFADFLSKSVYQLKRLERLVSDLLDVSKIISGKLNYNNSRFDFADVISETINSIQLSVTSHNIQINNNASVLFEGDQHRIEQVIINLINNAIKYSPDSDQIIVNSSIINNNIVVSIQDFGIGIAKEHLSKLFERFYRIDNTAMKYEGLGLGLYIVSEIINRHEGNFWIESEEGKGSTFYFRLPLSERTELEKLYDATNYHSQSIDIVCNYDEKILEVDWKGFQSLESVKQGCMMILTMLRQNRLKKVLNSNVNVLGSWAVATEWVGSKWFPMMETAGLKQFALIYSPSVFSQLSANKSLDFITGDIASKTFETVDEAKKWLNLENS